MPVRAAWAALLCVVIVGLTASLKDNGPVGRYPDGVAAHMRMAAHVLIKKPSEENIGNEASIRTRAIWRSASLRLKTLTLRQSRRGSFASSACIVRNIRQTVFVNEIPFKPLYESRSTTNIFPNQKNEI